MVTRRLGIIVLLFCFYLNLMLCPVQAASTEAAVELIDVNQRCTLTITYSGNGEAFSKMPVALYHIADVSANFQYTLTSAFEASGLTLNGVQSNSEWNVIRATLEGYILANKVEENIKAETNSAGQVSFDSLTLGLYLAIPEAEVREDTTCIFDSALVALPGLGEDGRWQYQVAVTAKSEILPPVDSDETIELKILKLWKGDDRKVHRPKSIQVEIFRNGKSYEKVTLSEANHWSYSWMAKADGAKWMVVERNVPEGYVVSIEKRGTTFILTNTLIPEKPPAEDRPSEKPPEKPNEKPTEKPTVKPPATENPKTGDTPHILLFTVLMYASGMILVLLALTGKRKRHEK